MDSIDDANKARAALEKLEAEKQRRREERIAAGEVVIVGPPYIIMAETPEEADRLIEAAKAREIEQRRARGDEREVIFDDDAIWAVVTGAADPDEYECPTAAHDGPGSSGEPTGDLQSVPGQP